MHLKFKDLLEIVAKLRKECPWDREQTIESLMPCLLEEAKEVEEAVAKGDLKNLEEELGDVMFTLMMIAQIASEKGDFDMGSVLEKSALKLVERHTWVFGDDEASTPEEAMELWLKNKAKKRKLDA